MDGSTRATYSISRSAFSCSYMWRNKFWLAFAMASLTAINRETGAFAAVFYICMVVGRAQWLPLAWRSLLLGLVPYVGAILVRKWILGDLVATSTRQWYTGFLFNLEQLLATIKRPSPISWPPLLFAMMFFPWLMFLNRVM